MNTLTRTDGKVKAKLLVDNGETAVYWAAWADNNGGHVFNFTSCSSERFNREFS